jgi:phenylalanyl-tRNA synthetase beta chain
MKVLHSWLKEYIGDALPDSAEVERLLTFHAFEIEEILEKGEETVIDVKILPDRAADCLSHRGIAREIATHLNVSLARDPFTEDAVLAPQITTMRIVNESAAKCRRFAIARIDGVHVGPSPAWLVSRLEALGQRSINNVVDATNYVMLGLGQPLHAYDSDKLTMREGAHIFRIRMAQEGETITTLSNEERQLTESIPVIADGNTDTPLSIAGVKGGTHAAIDTGTTTLIVEAANFDPQLTRKAAQSLRLPTDAAKRFENNISPRVVPYALHAVVQLILEIAGGTCAGFADTGTTEEENMEVTVSLALVNARLGLVLTAGEVEDILKRLGFTSTANGETWHIRAPFERRDIRIPEDVIEEIGRVHGYAHVPSISPTPAAVTEIHATHYYAEKIRGVLLELGISEVITSSFRERDQIELRNALASDKGCLRSTLGDGVREALDRNMPNADLLGLAQIQIFEIGTVFHKTEAGDDVTEHLSLAVGVRTKQQGYVAKDDARLMEINAALEQALGVATKAVITKGVIECNLSELITQLPQPTAYDAYDTPAPVTFAPYSVYPFISRDIAMWAPEHLTSDAISASITSHAGPLLIRITLFDTFAKEGRVSYAFRLIFQSFERTLTDTEVGEAMQRISDALIAQGLEIR